MFYQNFERLCIEHKVAPMKVAKDIGISRGAPSNWKQNGNVPRGQTIQKIADYFGVSVDTLLADEEPIPSKLHREKGQKIPVLSSVGAGIPMESINTFDADDPDAWEEISRDMGRNGEFFALRIKGDSMEPRIRRGDILVVRVQPTVEEGEVAVVLINGNEGVCKRIHFRDDGIQLLSNNPEYAPMTYTWEETKSLPVRIVGKVEEIRGKP